MKRIKVDQDDKQLAALAAKLKEPAKKKRVDPNERDRGAYHLPSHPKEKQSFSAEPAKKKRRKPAPRAKKPPLRDITLPDAIDEAFCEIEALAQEMRDWADNLEEKFSETQKYQTVDSTADTLENMTNPMEGIDDADRAWLNELVIVGFQDPTPRRAGYSRADRCAQSCDLLDRVSGILEDYKGPEARETIANDLYGDVEAMVQECQGVEFPGAYG